MPKQSAEAQIEAAVYRACLAALTRPGVSAGKAISKVRALLVEEAEAVAAARRAAGVPEQTIALHLAADLNRAKSWQPHQAAVFRTLERRYQAFKPVRWDYSRRDY